MPSLADYLLANRAGGNFGTMSPGEEAVAVTPGSVLDALARSAVGTGPSFASKAMEQSQRDQAAYARGGVPELMRDTQNAEELASGFVGGPLGIKAYHGSPYDFARFDLSKVGTGEGAQAYGHGLYFAENPDTAAAYEHSTSGLRDWPVVGDNPDWRVPSWVGKTASASPRGLDMMIEDFTNRATQMKAENHWNAGGIQDIVDALQAVKAGKAELKKPGHQYEVDINADPEHFLDWDKPLSEQHPQVAEKLSTIVKDRDRAISDWINSSPGAEQRLREAGIPGIKYLDQGSRGSGAGTSNYVVFDDKLINIIKKYGLAGALLGAGTQFRSSNEQ